MGNFCFFRQNAYFAICGFRYTVYGKAPFTDDRIYQFLGWVGSRRS